MNIILACLPSVITGIFLFVFQHKIEKREKSEVMRDNVRNNYIKLIVDLTLATHALSEANASAMSDSNEEIRRALEYARQMKHKHRDFLEYNGIQNIF